MKVENAKKISTPPLGYILESNDKSLNLINKNWHVIWFSIFFRSSIQLNVSFYDSLPDD